MMPRKFVTSDRRKAAHLKAKAKAYYQAASFLAMDGYHARSSFLLTLADKATTEHEEINRKINASRESA